MKRITVVKAVKFNGSAEFQNLNGLELYFRTFNISEKNIHKKGLISATFPTRNNSYIFSVIFDFGRQKKT